MKRRLTNALAAAALLALSLTAGHEAGAQEGQAPERTGVKRAKAVRRSCPAHPEVKARSAGRCPKCRAAERKVMSARDKEASRAAAAQQQQGVTPEND
jgi:hypothetical protein